MAVARELGALFQELETSTEVSIAPKQRLANARADEIFQDTCCIRTDDDCGDGAERQRPATFASQVTSCAPGTGPKVVVNAVMDASETSSDVSSRDTSQPNR